MTTRAMDRTGGADRTGTAATRLRSRHLLGIEGLGVDEIALILDTAEAMKEIAARPIKKVPALRGHTVVNLFFEPSTRTRTSFEVAEKRLSADTLSIATATSSVTKGETLVDTVRNIEAMAPDMIVLRHSSAGAPHLLSRMCRSAIINAGDGTHEHPTQALLDAFTIREHKGRLAGLKVAIVGDLLHSRVMRSNALLLNTMGAHVWACGPSTLMPAGIERLGLRPTTSIDAAVADADVVMLLRIQHERMHGHFVPSLREYFAIFGMTPERLRRAKPDVIIMHPGPMNRGVEIDSEVADGPFSVILEQVSNGVAVRMAVLYLLAGREGDGEELEIR
ncbi:MAG TPA: aspartate carbamoyltransferase catalytic subunit [Vicinamibacterales bacterium]|jgi:aspartate carbamoyltransferase catalytic subunit|nr:aspartate carbamoyltransferase catalytic subunit [Vicinamibacterales bacterium]